MSETALQPVRLAAPSPGGRSGCSPSSRSRGRRRRARGRHATEPSGAVRLANNGLVAYAEAGDIFTVDPTTGARRQVTTGLDEDIDPRWSLDGSRIAFLRGPIRQQVVIVDADGGNPVTSRDPLAETDADGLEWAPDGNAVP